MKHRLSLLFIFSLCFTGAIAQSFNGKTPTILVKIGTDSNTKILEWINPSEPNLIVRSQKFLAEVGIKGESEIKQADIYVNGKKSVDRGFKVVPSVDTKYNRIISQEVYLTEGINDLTISVVDNSGNVLTDSRTIQYLLTGTGSNNRTDYAILFGTDNYDYWDNLINPIKDTRAVASELEKNYGFKVEIITDPTSEEVWGKVRDYAQKSYTENDQLFIFFAGHGQFDDVFGEGYLVCKDSKINDKSKSSYISHVRLRNIINNIPCKHIFLVIDACFGGTFDPVIARAGLRGNDNVGELPKTEFINRKLQFKTRRYLSSGGKTYVPDGRPGQHSPFARKLLEALRTYGGNDQVVTLYEIINNVEKINPEPRFGEFGDNEPGSDFIFEAK